MSVPLRLARSLSKRDAKGAQATASTKDYRTDGIWLPLVSNVALPWQPVFFDTRDPICSVRGLRRAYGPNRFEPIFMAATLSSCYAWTFQDAAGSRVRELHTRESTWPRFAKSAEKRRWWDVSSATPTTFGLAGSSPISRKSARWSTAASDGCAYARAASGPTRSRSRHRAPRP